LRNSGANTFFTSFAIAVPALTFLSKPIDA